MNIADLLKNLTGIGNIENFATVISCIGIRGDDYYLNENKLKLLNYNTNYDDLFKY